MVNGQIRHDLASPDYLNPDDYLSMQIQALLTTCHCELLQGKDYELEISAQAINALEGDNETADVYLYAAIEREDWDEVKRLYQKIFRPAIYKAISQLIYQKTGL